MFMNLTRLPQYIAKCRTHSSDRRYTPPKKLILKNSRLSCCMGPQFQASSITQPAATS